MKNFLRASGRLSVFGPDQCVAPVGLGGRHAPGKVPSVVPQKTWELGGGGPLSGGDAKVEVDVRVYAEQEVLEDQWPPPLGGLEHSGLGSGRPRLRAPCLQRIEVALGEGNVQPQHPGIILKLAALDGRVDSRSDVPIEGHKVPESTPLFCRLRNNVVEFRKNLID